MAKSVECQSLTPAIHSTCEGCDCECHSLTAPATAVARTIAGLTQERDNARDLRDVLQQEIVKLNLINNKLEIDNLTLTLRLSRMSNRLDNTMDFATQLYHVVLDHQDKDTILDGITVPEWMHE